MDKNHLYSKKEISKILARASEIQTKKDLYGDQEGLTKEELIHVAEEVGISADSLLEAIYNSGPEDLDLDFDWLVGSSKIQGTSIVEGEITAEVWEEVVHDIRKITGGIGKINKVGSSYEWEQRRKELGYRHISLSPHNEQTKIQLVSNWNVLKYNVSIISAVAGFTITAIFLDGTNLPDIAYMLIPSLGGLSGFGLGRIVLKNYFKNQKSQFKTLLSSIQKRLSSSEKKITIEEKEVYEETSSENNSSSSLKF